MQSTAARREPRLAYRVDELARLTGLSRRTIERRIADGTLKSTRMLGARLVTAESVKIVFGPASLQ
jgi:excisionase family DNA binding protein